MKIENTNKPFRFSEKIFILPNSKGKKSVHTDKISMRGRSDTAMDGK